MWRGISLADKCLLLFGGAVALILVAAMIAPFVRMIALVDAGQVEVSRQMVSAWERVEAESGHPASRTGGQPMDHAGVIARFLTPERAEELARNDPFVRSALRALRRDAERLDFQEPRWRGRSREYRYAKAVRQRTAGPAGAPASASFAGMVVLERRSVEAARLLLVSGVYLLCAGVVVSALAVLVFYQITHRLILEPVRTLRRTAERVRDGELTIRSDISTGDEFQELAETFNLMLASLQTSQDQLRAINAAMDLKLNELAEANKVLFEAARVKGEFLANVSHELRTPLNSIIGFAELMLENARAEQGDAADPAAARRIRYLENIAFAGRNLLELINDLLEMARVEAGKVELHPEPTKLGELAESLIGLILPVADRKGLETRLEVAPDLPVIETDPRKLRQVIFNFLSNAVKFTEPQSRTGRPGVVTLRVERLVGADPSSERVRLSVIDTGPGIPEEEHQRIFEKFHQVEGAYQREHAGAGLGLAICKEFAALLQGEIQLVSGVGKGSMFSLILPLSIDHERAAEARLEARFRGALAGRGAFTAE